MDFVLGGLFALIGFGGLALACGLVRDSDRGSTREKIGSYIALLGGAAALIMVFQGLHLWNQGWDISLDPDTAAKAASKARGKGGIIVLIIQFFPQFLVFGYGGLLVQARDVLSYSFKLLKPAT